MASQAKKRLVVANWKMYIQGPTAARDFLKGLKRRAESFADVEVILAPALPLIPLLAKALEGSKISVGAQTLSRFSEGAHTGEVSATMLKGSGASSVIVGHSERRREGESEEHIREELLQADDAGLRSILCIGEETRDQGGAHFVTLEKQLRAALQSKVSAKRLVIAYEPVWAIGKSALDAMKPQELRETVIFIRKILAEHMGRDAALRVPILYGGSVEPENARALIADGDVAGFLVGHASADLQSFLPILEACKR